MDLTDLSAIETLVNHDLPWPVPSQEPNVEALEKMEEILIENANNEKGMRFDLEVWVRPYVQWDRSDRAIDCGTVGCAIGLAGLHPWFQERGFQTRFGSPEWLGAEWGYKSQWGAVKGFFRIDEEVAARLFTSPWYTTVGLPTQGKEGELAVAKRVREYLDYLKPILDVPKV